MKALSIVGYMCAVVVVATIGCGDGANMPCDIFDSGSGTGTGASVSGSSGSGGSRPDGGTGKFVSSTVAAASSSSGAQACDEIGVCGDFFSGCAGCSHAGVCKPWIDACLADQNCLLFGNCVVSCKENDFPCLSVCATNYSQGADNWKLASECIGCTACKNSCAGQITQLKC
jgi:hypothetical protein